VTYTNSDDTNNPKEAVKTVAVTIVSDSTVVSANQRFSIDAQSITLKSTDARAAFAGATDATVLEGSTYNKVSAQKRDTDIADWGAATATQTIEPDNWDSIKSGKNGIYQVTYTNEDDNETPKVSKTVNVTITDESSGVVAETTPNPPKESSGDFPLFNLAQTADSLTIAMSCATILGMMLLVLYHLHRRNMMY
jgi:hypothetical protein